MLYIAQYFITFVIVTLSKCKFEGKVNPRCYIKVNDMLLFPLYASLLKIFSGQYTGRGKPLPEYHVKIAGFDERVGLFSRDLPLSTALLGHVYICLIVSTFSFSPFVSCLCRFNNVKVVAHRSHCQLDAFLGGWRRRGVGGWGVGRREILGLSILLILWQVLVMSSIRKPKRIIIRGDDEKDYMFLVKGGEDLRLDQRIEQVSGEWGVFFRLNEV